MLNLGHSQPRTVKSLGVSLLQVYAGRAAQATYNLSVGQPEMSPPLAAVNAVKDFVGKPDHARYSPAAGSPSLLVALAKVFRDLGFAGVGSDNVAVSNGAKSLINSVLMLFGGSGTPVFWFEPGYTYGRMAEINGLDSVALHLTPNPAEFDQVVGMIDDHYRQPGDVQPGVLIINTPTNPTGMVWSQSQLEVLAEKAIRYKLLVLADETYADLTYSGHEHVSFAQLPYMFERTITIRSASKELRMPGYRIGYAVGPQELIGLLKTVLGDCEGCPSTLSQTAFESVIGNHRQYAEEQLPDLIARRQLVIDWCAKHGLEHYLIGGAFYAFIHLCPGRDSVALADQLLDHNPSVGIIPGRAFCEYSAINGWGRISFAGSKDDLVEGLKVIAEVIKQD